MIGTPLFIFFGWWLDRVGRKYIMLTGMLLAAILYRPIYGQIFATADLTTKTKLEGSGKYYAQDIVHRRARHGSGFDKHLTRIPTERP